MPEQSCADLVAAMLRKPGAMLLPADLRAAFLELARRVDVLVADVQGLRNERDALLRRVHQLETAQRDQP